MTSKQYKMVQRSFYRACMSAGIESYDDAKDAIQYLKHDHRPMTLAGFKAAAVRSGDRKFKHVSKPRKATAQKVNGRLLFVLY